MMESVEKFISVVGALEDVIFQKRMRLLQRDKNRRARDRQAMYQASALAAFYCSPSTDLITALLSPFPIPHLWGKSGLCQVTAGWHKFWRNPTPMLCRQHQGRQERGQQPELTRSGQEPNRKWTAAAPSVEFKDLLRPAQNQPTGDPRAASQLLTNTCTHAYCRRQAGLSCCEACFLKNGLNCRSPQHAER